MGQARKMTDGPWVAAVIACVLAAVCAACGGAVAGSSGGGFDADTFGGDGAGGPSASDTSADAGSAGANSDSTGPQADTSAATGAADSNADAAQDSSGDALAPAALAVMIYGVVNSQKCGSKEAFDSYTTQLVDPAVVSKELTNLKTQLTAQNPGKFIKVASSKFEYGPTARHMCALKWTVTNSGCAYDIFIVEFGKTAEEALDLAMKRMKLYAPKNAPYAIVEQKAW